MSGIEVTIRFTKREAMAILKSEGLHCGWGVKGSIALDKAEAKLMAAVQAAWNEELANE